MKKVLTHKQKLISLLGDCKNACILDYGCGKGDFIDLILGETQKPKEIWAVDSGQDMMTSIQNNFASAINEGIVVPKLASSPIELHENKFDKIICHNVLECVEDKLGFINGFKPLLNQNAIFILSHHDFDSAIYNSIYETLSRNLVHHFSDKQQVWQKYSDGQMGRKIPGLMNHSVFRECARCETWRMVETKFEAGTYGFLMADMVMEIGKATFSNADMHTWYQDLIQKSRLGEYYFAIDLVVSICTPNSYY
jgi:ubiquinone/menaquinone biosynthesis C-methylase UbiE